MGRVGEEGQSFGLHSGLDANGGQDTSPLQTKPSFRQHGVFKSHACLSNSVLLMGCNKFSL